MRHLAIPPTIQVQSPGVISTMPNIVHSAIQSVSTSSSISPAPVFNNTSIRVRLPDTPTPPNLLQQAVPIIQKHGRGDSITTNIPISPTLVTPTSTPVSVSGQLQSSQQPTMVTIQGQQVIISPQVGHSPSTQGLTTNTSGNSTLVATNPAGVRLAAVRPSQPMGSLPNTVVSQQAIASQPNMHQLRPQQTSTASNLIVRAPANIFRVPAVSGGSSSAATVIVNASGVSGQTTQLPQTVVVRLCKTLILVLTNATHLYYQNPKLIMFQTN